MRNRQESTNSRRQGRSLQHFLKAKEAERMDKSGQRAAAGTASQPHEDLRGDTAHGQVGAGLDGEVEVPVLRWLLVAHGH
eukprot:65068-Pyramimonas_sp.AAC.1